MKIKLKKNELKQLTDYILSQPCNTRIMWKGGHQTTDGGAFYAGLDKLETAYWSSR